MAPCHGHVTSSPDTSPSESGPPRCVQVSSMAKKVPPRLKSAIFFPATSTHFASPGARSIVLAILMNCAMGTSYSAPNWITTPPATNQGTTKDQALSEDSLAEGGWVPDPVA